MTYLPDGLSITNSFLIGLLNYVSTYILTSLRCMKHFHTLVEL